ncbi:peroxisomal hydratase-dehydrogenase-epimerase [Monomorium pharaonis]|uniref:peroxisomal hydratase-dehydrogenase-epimerase n=1 Tax=Monomorium pharaonis TaxID=307658 RepID=UPI00063EF516|nr:peroxisomal hydratase-dehydrogenase-epimerase [Monomorium pharaonis]
MQIKDKRVIVTGAASEVGLAFSRELLRNGALMIVIIDIQQLIGEQVVQSLNNEFGRKRAVFLCCDVTNNSEFDATFKEAINILGGLDILINNVGVINEIDFAKAIDVNVTAVIRGTLMGIQQMRKDSGGKGGVIVNISSIAGLQSVSQFPVYSAAKHAVVSFSRSFAQPYHYQKTNVKVIVLCPGLTDTSVLEDLPQDISNTDIFQNYQPQKVETVAHGLVYVIRCAQNGSVWISEDGKPIYEVLLPDTLPQKTEMDAENYERSQSSVVTYYKHKLSILRLHSRGFKRRKLIVFVLRIAKEVLFIESKMENIVNPSLRTLRRRSSASERAKELEAINCIVSGKNVLITGGAAGLGYAFLNHFLKHGAKKVIILDIDAETSKRLALGIEKSYGEKKVHFICTDVSNHKQVTESFEEASSLLGNIDIVINNAGVLDERRWEKEIAVNVTGMVNTAMLAMQHMSKDTGGHGGILVNVSQHIDVQNTAQLPVYTATKNAVIGLSQSLSNHYEKTGVTVITLCPGLTETALTIESPNKLLSRVMKADFVKNLEQFSIQTPYVVAQGLMTILRIGESGSIWVIESGKVPYEVYVPNPRTLRRHYKNNFPHVDAKVARGRAIREVCDNARTGLMSCA